MLSLPSMSWLADTSLRASAVIVLLFCTRPLLRRWVGSRAVAWLWLAIVARLLCPLPVSAPWHLRALLPPPAAAAASPFHFRVSVAPADPLTASRAAMDSSSVSHSPTSSGPDILSLLWFSGALVAAGRLAWGWWTIRRWATDALPADTYPSLHSSYLALPVELRRGVALCLTRAVDIPTLVGALHPQIWLPRALPDTLTATELRHVLLHELGHVRRRDLLAQWLCALACCLHWFNPLVWFLARAARLDRELACDAWVLSQEAMKAEPAVSYGHTLLKVVEGMCGRPPRALPLVSMAAGKRHLGLRVHEIRAFRQVPRWRGAVALAAILTLVAAFTVRNARAASERDPASPQPPLAPSSPPPPPSTPAAVSPVTAAPPPPAPGPAARPMQVEIESKFVEVPKSRVSALEKSVPPSSPVGSVFHQVFARFTAPRSSAAPAIFRSSLVLPDDFQLLVRQLNEAKGVDLLSAPRVTTHSGQKATIEIIREFIYPTAFQRDKGTSDQPVTTPTSFDTKNTGVTLEVNPTIEPSGDVIDLSLTWTITNFDGFVDANGQPVSMEEGGVAIKFPVFDSHSVSTVLTLSSGATVVFGMDAQHFETRKSLERLDGAKVDDFDFRFVEGLEKHKSVSKEEDERLLLIFVTATLVPPSGVVPPGTRAPENPVSATAPPGINKPDQPLRHAMGSPASLPHGVPVPGKPGFATSPYAPDAGYVDMRGFKRDESVRDPYTGKLFLAP